MFGALAAAIKNRQWTGAVFYSFFLVSLCFLAYAQMRRRRPVPQPGTTVFQPFLALSELDPWPRPSDLNSIVRALDTESQRLPLVVGPSGSGKTVLLQRLLTDQLSARKVPHYYIDEYSGFRGRMTNLLNDIEGSVGGTLKQPVIILDQFEQYLARMRQLSPDARDREHAWFKELITAHGRNLDIRFLISIRSEWYYDLEWLGEIVPAPANCLSIKGPRADAEDDITRRSVAIGLQRVINDDDVVEAVLTELGRGKRGRILLLETQIVGAVLERDKFNGSKIGESYIRETLGGIEGAIDKYFEGILQGAPNRRVAMKVLCALSVRTYFRRQQDMADLLERLFEEAEDIREALQYLSQCRLVIVRPTARYELAHDYLAEYFHQKSGSELDPVDRDNVLYHFESDIAKVNPYVEYIAREGGPHEASAQREGRGAFGSMVIIPLIVFMTVRLIDFGFPWLQKRDQLFQQLLWGNRFFDVVYMPTYIAHLGWAIYVSLLYSRLLSKLNETPVQRLFSRLVVLNMAACVILAMFFPYVWLASIGWGGMVVGLKLLSISRVRRINSAAKGRFRLFGGITSFNLIFLTSLGVIAALSSVHYVKNAASRDVWIYISCLFTLVVTYACVVLSAAHVQHKGVSQLLGLLARMHTSSAPSMTMQ